MLFLIKKRAGFELGDDPGLCERQAGRYVSGKVKPAQTDTRLKFGRKSFYFQRFLFRRVFASPKCFSCLKIENSQNAKRGGGSGGTWGEG